MLAKKCVFLLMVAIFGCSPIVLGDLAIDWSEVGGAGNAADSRTGYGAVDYNYKISTYEVTNDQYAAYLNAVDPRGLNGWSLLHAGMSISIDSGAEYGSKFVVDSGQGNKPVTAVSYNRAIKFVNWLSKGLPTTPIEPLGSYTANIGDIINTGSYTSAAGFVARNPDAEYFLPNMDEWYKAAYYSESKAGGDAGYYNFPTRNDGAPGRTSTLPSSVENQANYGYMPGYITDVGSYTESESPWGTYDMAGNVYEWIEYKVSGTGSDDVIKTSAGYYANGAGDSWNRLSYLNFDGTSDSASQWDSTFNGIGFRVAMIPEPATMLLCVVGGGILIRRKK